MNTKNILFAVLLTCISGTFIMSCSQDDDYTNEHEFPTLAKGVLTRAAEQQDKKEQEEHYIEVKDSIINTYNVTLHAASEGIYHFSFTTKLYVMFSHDEEDNKPIVYLVDYETPPRHQITEVSLEKAPLRELYVLKVKGADPYNREFNGEYEHLFQL